MRKLLVLAGVAATLSFAPAPSFAQVGIDLPGVGVRIGEPHPHYGYTHRSYDEPRVYERGPAYREREVYLRDRSCRTVTIERDGVVKRIRRCD
jgi:hypothetical protein